MTVKTRFAPSPTGYLHIGGARTALYSWLHARKMNGVFALRIEDTDRERSTDESVQAILEGMEWLGLDYDEGPIFQTHRFDRYAEVIQELMDSGHAYHCYCSREELDAMREQQWANKEKPRYNGCCRDRTEPVEGVDPVVRFRNPLDGDVVINDLVKGEIVINNRELDDLIIARSDGTPTYNLTVVVDDLDMNITHVIRGDDHINNTPRQINIMLALGATLPEFAHVPMILGDDGKRLSKRHGAVGVMQYRDDGFLPEAVLNYLIRLGWAHGDQEIFTLEEMLEFFKIEDVHGAPSAFNTDKLIWMNQQYLKTLPAENIAAQLQWHLDNQKLDTSNGPALTDVIEAQRDRAKTLVDLVSSSRYFFEDFEAYDEKALSKQFKPGVDAILKTVRDQLSELSDWNPEAIESAIKASCEAMDLKLGKVGPPLRLAVAGTPMSPGLDVTLSLVGRERTLARIDKAIATIEAMPA
ncbi:glutamate--tRNA ligase [Leucothrix mucor]|uniref:glutamate--tRNA ligase n=1 Tax=Leucothrix mucor TaxID=45248 RepID=UPI0003B7B6FE|nr:glutamate--tRNA ligase [Leucothrix mucor]